MIPRRLKAVGTKGETDKLLLYVNDYRNKLWSSAKMQTLPSRYENAI